jgi:DNA-binding response OmpR family regulator
LPSTSHPPRAIVGHDDPWRADDIAAVLERHGFEARGAYDGDAVLRLVESWDARHVAIELSISGMPAYQVGHRIRQRLGDKVRLVGVTALTDPHYRVEAMAAGFDDVILGRLDPAEILLALGGPTAALVRRQRVALFRQAREMIALGHRLLNGRRFLLDEDERRRRVALARRALEWSGASLDVTSLDQETRLETERDLQALAARLAFFEAETRGKPDGR